jgi:DNA repair protein RecO (recombination protein O)
MLIKTRGIVFRAIKYSETSIIADIYTEEKGDALLPHQRGAQQESENKSQPAAGDVNLVDMVAYDKHAKGLNRVKEMRSAYVYQQPAIRYPQKRGRTYSLPRWLVKRLREPEENERLVRFLIPMFSLPGHHSKMLSPMYTFGFCSG